MVISVMLWLVLIFVALGIIIYAVAIYNGLVRLSRNIEKAWANIDVILKQRRDEIPKLVKTCEGYMQYEQDTLEKITAARTFCIQAKTVAETAQKEAQLSSLLRQLFAVAENYPSLKADQTFLQLQQRISYLENQIADRRELYNDSVNNYNIRIHQIPDMFVARLCGFSDKELFNITDTERKDVDIDFNLPK
ncbi:MAG: LemA family protein [Candidatus Omnitrophica bacterium]|nr:LemA family protein [Candidatus Omnitrophota bacterium]